LSVNLGWVVITLGIGALFACGRVVVIEE